jgi:hypothetical protein
MVVFRSSRRLDFLGVALFPGSLCAGIALASQRALGVAVAARDRPRRLAAAGRAEGCAALTGARRRPFT